jgi:hypothetical protein
MLNESTVFFHSAGIVVEELIRRVQFISAFRSRVVLMQLRFQFREGKMMQLRLLSFGL